MTWQTNSVGEDFVRAPDGSEIRPLVTVSGGSMVHCRLPAGRVTQAVQHRTVDEVWYCVRGTGQVWRGATEGLSEVVDLAPGVAVSIPLGAQFQFRAGAADPLEVVITTLPPWPGADEAFAVDGPWKATVQ